MNELQALVDALAGDLARPVGVDDRHFHALAYSAHEQEVDPVRRESILRRAAPAAVTEWLASLRIDEQPGHARVPANADLGMAARVCLPLRFDGLLLGYLWLIDEPQPLDAAALAASRRCAAALAAVLAHARRLEDDEREREARLVRDLLLETGDVEEAAARLGTGAFARARGYVAIVATAEGSTVADGPAATDLRLALAADQLRRSVAPRHALAAVGGGEAYLALAFDDPDDPQRRASALLDAAREQLPDARDGTVLVAVGGVRATVAQLRASCTEARHALRVAQAVPETAAPARWDALGAYRTVAELVGDREPLGMLPSALVRLLDERDGETLLATLEAYLEHGCDAQAAAGALFLHRSSLYNRLHRIEQIIGRDLRRGDDRLELHLGVRLWRLAGTRQPSG
ncbi:PucR family transcriptional regulator [Conexibacter woesei]|uniref:Transcriptional regulator, CdaR n=1 Tax=Conexibacter woesei (strain DSM 14684 / CCUG 47730 / CIP 108061 / JCM 11494 / NBRC 100937 / ID131577) TaxID=469383 RepID=D3F6E8_CONWI|nr:helix-turn-helix domain-containing protein [Conexibacter woesei]ADB50715.1 transcriptional regulator, CdaR [Conexibacter woesei DSM 14684]